MKNMLKIMMLAVTLVAVMGIGTAYSIPMISISDGVTTIEITDGNPINSMGGIGDLTPLDGLIMNFTSIGVFNLVTETGITKPYPGYENPLRPEMDFTGTVKNITGSGTLTLMFTETDFGPGSDYDYLVSSIGGATDIGSITYKTYLDEANTAFATSILLADLGPFTSCNGCFSGKLGSMINPSGLFSLTTVIEITHNDAGGDTAFGSKIVPEPTTLLLIGSGLVGVAFYSRRKKL